MKKVQRITESNNKDNENMLFENTAINDYYTKFELAWQNIKKVEESGEVANVIIGGAQILRGQVYLSADIEGIKVLIPKSEFFYEKTLLETSERETSPEDKLRAAAKCFGAVTSIVVTNCVREEKPEDGNSFNYVVLGSRKKALAIKQKAIINGIIPKIKVGDYIKVKVILPRSKSIVVEDINTGIECVIPYGKLSQISWLNINKKYPANKILFALVEEVNQYENGLFTLKLSCAFNDMQEWNIQKQKIRVGELKFGCVTAISERNYLITLKDTPLKAVCTKEHFRESDKGGPLEVGDLVTFHVDEINDRTFTILGYSTYIGSSF